MKLVFENPHTEIYDISEEIPHTVFAHWRGFLLDGKAEAIEACQVSLDYFRDANVWVMISDHQHLEGASVPFLNWLHDYYFPTAVQNGLRAEIILDAELEMGNIVLDLMYNPDDLYKNVNEGEIYTPKIDTLENAKVLARQIVEKQLSIS